jgi:hypothetical protein
MGEERRFFGIVSHFGLLSALLLSQLYDSSLRYAGRELLRE